MNLSELPKRTIKLTSADPLESPLPTTFNRRLDVIVPVNAGTRLGAQVARYTLVSGVRLTDLFTDGFVVSSDLQVMTMRDERDGAWSIDGQRGKLALKVTKERYESLGIVGRPKNGAYIIEVDLQEKTSSAFARAKGLLGKWDRAWDVWVIGGEDGSVFQGGIKSLKEVMPESVVLEDVFVPSSLPKELEEDEPWAEIFEWVGLCTLGRRGSPRIRCQDQPNSYIACYSPPDGSRVASITRFRWEGFISEIFVRECVRVAKEEARDGLVAFSVQSYAHVTVPSSSTRYEARAGVGVSGDWALAEMMVPM